MPNLLKIIIAAVVSLIIGYGLGHRSGVSDGKGMQLAAQAVMATKEVTKATKQRDAIDDETRKIPDPALDAELSAGGWLRD